MNFDNLLLERDGAVAIITINRPAVLNALNTPTTDELRRAVLQLKHDAGVRVVILTGAGEKSFVAGADINELAALKPAQGKEHAQRGQHVFDLIENMGKPVIAAVNGFALGGGCELAMACTLRMAADTARFGQPEINLGIIPGYAGTQRLSRLVGKGIAFDLLLTGRQIKADEALQIGLVNRVVPAAELMTEAKKLAGDARVQGARCAAVHHRSGESRPRGIVRQGTIHRSNPLRPRRLHCGHARRDARVPRKAQTAVHGRVWGSWCGWGCAGTDWLAHRARLSLRDCRLTLQRGDHGRAAEGGAGAARRSLCAGRGPDRRARARRLRDPRRGAPVGRERPVRRDHLPRMPDQRRHDALRVHRGGRVARDRASGRGDRRANCLWRADDDDRGAGGGARRRWPREQGARGGGCCRGDGHSLPSSDDGAGA